MDLKAVKVNGIIADLRKMLERIIGEDIEFKRQAASENWSSMPIRARSSRC